MKKSDFAKYLTSFFEYIRIERGYSPKTICSYSTAFKLFLEFLSKEDGIKADYIMLKDVNRKNVSRFLNWLQAERNSSDRTRNQRFAALSSFAHFMQYEDVANLEQWNDILTIHVKKTVQESVLHMTPKAVKLLLESIPANTPTGLRDLAMLSLLYESAARVQELIDLTPRCLMLTNPCKVKLHGKGNKTRMVNLNECVKILRLYMERTGLDLQANELRPLFCNNRQTKMSNAGIAYVIQRYIAPLQGKYPGVFPDNVTPHTFRHSRAMHLVANGVNLIYIRDILGHTSIKTTEHYARADSKQKNEAIENAYKISIPEPDDVPSWEKDQELIEWLKSLGK